MTPRPQFPPRSHRAREHMEALGRRWPVIWSLVDRIRVANRDAIGGPDWPRYTYLPLEHAGIIAVQIAQLEGIEVSPTTIARIASEIATLAAWRMTQGIYRFDPALYAALIATPIDGDVPASVLRRLPEWCVYVETPDLTVPTTQGAAPLHGTYAWLDHARGADHDILTLLLDADGLPLTVTHIPLIGSIAEAVEANAAEWRLAYERGNAPSLPPAQYQSAAVATLQPIVSLILYLCADDAELGDGEKRPANPEPVRTRRNGWRLFPAQRVTTWNVGVRLGAALRRAYQEEQTRQASGPPTGRTVRPHIRRAHWHTFLAGPRSGERERRIKWLPPIPVRLNDRDELPATIRRVADD